MISVTKTYRAEYAHIVRKAYSKRCRENVHGHSGVFEITLSADKQDEAGMVLDFGNMKEIKQLVDMFDHTFLMWDQEDPEMVNYFTKNFSRVLIMKKNTTAENMARVVLHYSQKALQEILHRCFSDEYIKESNIRVSQVTVHETITGKATAIECDKDDVFTAISKDCQGDLKGDLFNEGM